MIGVNIAAKKEWRAVLEKFNISSEICKSYPFGEYFTSNMYGEDLIFYESGVRKMNCSAATQYMIDHFNLSKIIVIGTCAGIDNNYKKLDIFVPNKVVQYDCTVKETEPLIKDSFTVLFDTTNLPDGLQTGTLGTADKPVVMWKDYLELRENNIAIADTETAAIAYICKANNVNCTILKGISDFPIKDDILTEGKTHQEQYNVFVENIPIVMNKVLDNYLEFAIKEKVDYMDYESKSTTIIK